MMAMYLTDKRNNINRELDDHEDLEVLLESFSKQVEEIVIEAQNMEVSSSRVQHHNDC
jgi:magnesium transporter